MTELTQSVPLTRDDDGTFRITGSRVTLDSIVRQFRNGATAEQIKEDFPSVSLSDIYSVIAYYLQHSRAVEDYLNERANAAEEIRRDLEKNLDTTDLRERLKQRRARTAV